MRKLRIFKTDPNAIIPTRATDGSAGYDLHVLLDKPLHFYPLQRTNFRTGICMEIPKGYFGAIFAKSGLSANEGIRPSTCVSVIDSDYRQEIMVPIVHEGSDRHDFHPGDRIAQIVFLKCNEFEFEETEDWQEDTGRTGGFGSTGR